MSSWNAVVALLKDGIPLMTSVGQMLSRAFATALTG